MIQFDEHIFQKGWNYQIVKGSKWYTPENYNMELQHDGSQKGISSVETSWTGGSRYNIRS